MNSDLRSLHASWPSRPLHIVTQFMKSDHAKILYWEWYPFKRFEKTEFQDFYKEHKEEVKKKSIQELM